MSEPQPTDHWDILVSKLGAVPPSQPEPQKTDPAAEQPKILAEADFPPPPQRRKAPEKVVSVGRPTPVNWDALASELGVVPPPSAPAKEPQRQPVVEREPPPIQAIKPPVAEPITPLPPREFGRGVPLADAEPAAAEARASGERARPSGEGEREEAEEGKRRRRKRRRKPRDSRAAEASAVEVPGAEVAASTPETAEHAVDQPGDSAVDAPPEQRRSKRRRRPDRKKKTSRDIADYPRGEAADAPFEEEPEEGLTAKPARSPRDRDVEAPEVEPDDLDAMEDLDEAGKADKPGHRSIPTWEEAIGMIVSVNLETRGKRPGGGASHPRSSGRSSGGGRKPRDQRHSGRKQSPRK